MATTGHVGVKEATVPDKNLATYSISEDAKTKEISRNTLSDSAGGELKGSKADAASIPVTQSTEDKIVLAAAVSALTSILAKIIAAPATEAKQGGGLPAALGAGGGLKVDGSGTELPVSATNLDIRDLTNADVVTAELSAVDNAVLDSILAKIIAAPATEAKQGGGLPAALGPNGGLKVDVMDSSTMAEGNTATITDTTVTEVLPAAGADLKWRITAIGVYNSDATVGTWVKIQDDTAGTPIVYWRGYAAPGVGFNLSFNPALPAKGQTNGKINVVAETTSAEIGCSVCAYKVAA